MVDQLQEVFVDGFFEIAETKVLLVGVGLYGDFDDVVMAMAGRVCAFAEELEVAVVG